MIRAIIVSFIFGIYVVGAADPTLEESRFAKGVASGSNVRQGARQPRPTRAPSLDEVRLALGRTLESGEEVSRVARAVGCTLVLTDRRLVLVRDGANYRPTSGIRAWPLDRDLTLRVGRTHGQTNRLTITHVTDSAGVFLSTEQFAGAQELIGEARRRTFAEDQG